MTLALKSRAPAFGPWALSLEILSAAEGPVLDTVAATEADLDECVGELWMASHLRRGRPDVPRDRIAVRLHPAKHKGAAGELDESGGMLCDGFILETDDPGGDTVRKAFIPDSMKLRAMWAASRLIQRGSLEPDQTFHYRLRVDRAAIEEPEPEPGNPGPQALAPAGVTATEESPSLCYRKLPLAPLLEAAEEVDGGGKGLHRVIYTKNALLLAEECSRKGIAEEPPIETGALLIGSLCSCPESGEFFCLVEDALEAVDAEGTSTSLTLTSRTWARISNIMKARSSQPETRTHRIVGQAHGHNFRPCTPEACEKCPDAGACAHLVSSAFFSIDDVRWMRSVFPGEPWAFGHVFGLSAKGEPMEALYSGFAGWMVRRGYHVIDEEAALAVIETHGAEG